VLCHGLLVEVAGNEVGQQRHGGPHSKKTLWTEESIGTASAPWLQTGTDGELLLPIVLTRTGGSKCKIARCQKRSFLLLLVGDSYSGLKVL